MAGQSGVDPFRAVQDEVARQMADIQTEIVKWQRLPSKSPKHEPTRQRIVSSLSELQVDLQDMQATIDIALKDPAKFALTPSELMTRQTFVRDLQAQANDARDSLDPNAATAANGRQGARATSSTHMGRDTLLSNGAEPRCCKTPESSSWTDSTPTSTKHSAACRDNEAALDSAQQQQQMIMETQDQELGVLGGALGRLGVMGKAMNDELRAQGRELDAFNEEVEQAGSKMSMATDAMKKMMKRKDRGKLCAILVLSIVLILLMYAVIAW